MKLPNFLVIGSYARNSGKTGFSQKLINSIKQDVVALKVTIIKKGEKAGICPRGGEGCGVCSSLKENFELTEETKRDGLKDTSKLLIAGASKVYWLRVKEDSVLEGLNLFLNKIDDSTSVICESNSIMKYINPAVFILLKSKTGKTRKESALNVESKADLIVETTENSINFNFEDMTFINNRWMLKKEATVIILAGGKSRRMGKDKSKLLIYDKTMIEHIIDTLSPLFKQIIVSSAKKPVNEDNRYETVFDNIENCGPISGITSALKYSQYNKNFVIACDNPEPDLQVINNMLNTVNEADVLILKNRGKRHEPLFAVYTKKMAAIFTNQINNGDYKIDRSFNELNIKYYEPEEELRLLNINTVDDYMNYLENN